VNAADMSELLVIVLAAMLIIGVMHECARIWMQHHERRNDDRRIEQWRRRQ
jgi:hypothetical protein